jgi:hypothetical protein
MPSGLSKCGWAISGNSVNRSLVMAVVMPWPSPVWPAVDSRCGDGGSGPDADRPI